VEEARSLLKRSKKHLPKFLRGSTIDRLMGCIVARNAPEYRNVAASFFS
jgi:hypothetical protein